MIKYLSSPRALDYAYGPAKVKDLTSTENSAVAYLNADPYSVAAIAMRKSTLTCPVKDDDC